MRNLYLSTLAIEVTRRCNMCCAHCLRGDAQAVDISDETLEKFLSRVSSIGTIVFTGGEPSIAVDRIQKILKICERNGISVSGFYIVTNGKTVTREFLWSMICWYNYVLESGGDPDMCALALSRDNFHSPILQMNETMLRALAFFCEDKFTDFRKVPLLRLGRARETNTYQTNVPRRYHPEIDIIDENEISVESNVLLSATGYILPECDYEYAETEAIALGHVDDMDGFVRTLEKMVEGDEIGA